MSPGYVKTIREEIFYDYAKLISGYAYGTLQRKIDEAGRVIFLGDIIRRSWCIQTLIFRSWWRYIRYGGSPATPRVQTIDIVCSKRG